MVILYVITLLTAVIYGGGICYLLKIRMKFFYGLSSVAHIVARNKCYLIYRGMPNFNFEEWE
jgi:hypothetical protein